MAKWQSKIGTQAQLIPKLRARPFARFCTDRAYMTSVTVLPELAAAALCPGLSLGLLGSSVIDERVF